MAHDSRQGRRGAWRVVIVSLGLAVAVVAAWGQPLQLDARTLSDQAFQIPGDLASGPAVLVVGFTKAAQKQTTAWSRQLTDLDKVSVYEVAILEDVPTLIRRFVIGSIKSAVPKALHDHFLIVSRGMTKWQALCPTSQKDAACVLLLGTAHDVIWRFAGDVTKQAMDALQGQLARSTGGN